MHKVVRLTLTLAMLMFGSGCKDHTNSAETVPDRALEDATDNTPAPPADPQPTDVKLVFDWHKQTDAVVCAGARANNNLLAVGVDFRPRNNAFNARSLQQLKNHLDANFSNVMRVVGQEDRLGILNLEITDCSIVADLRNDAAVQFVEPKYVAPINDELIYQSLLQQQAEERVLAAVEEAEVNPGLYDPATATVTYAQYLSEGGDTWTADVMLRHGVDRIYDEYQAYGDARVGVAVVDNGVLDDAIGFMSQGGGGYETQAYHRPTTTSPTDGVSPQPYDMYGLMEGKPIYHHGTQMTKNVYAMVPRGKLITARASPFVVWFTPTQFQGVVDAILALAENPHIKIISCSMGTIVYSGELTRAIDYFNAFDKLFVAAAGSTAPIIKDLVRIVFPASLPSTVSVTGLKERSDGLFQLGKESHGGRENDFVVDYSHASSESTSYTAGMIALIWSANPALSRQKLLDILIKSSNFYREQGYRDAVFGWGKIDAYEAYRAVLATRDDGQHQ